MAYGQKRVPAERIKQPELGIREIRAGAGQIRRAKRAAHRLGSTTLRMPFPKPARPGAGAPQAATLPDDAPLVRVLAAAGREQRPPLGTKCYVDEVVFFRGKDKHSL